MANTSASGGYLAVTAQAAYGAALDAIFQALIVSLSGLNGRYVRPCWQPTPPKQLEPDVNWCAVGVTDITPDAGPAFVADASGLKSSAIRHETIEVLASFYGPGGQGIANLVREGLALPQNWEAINAEQIYLARVGSAASRPELVNEQWIKRYDLPMAFRRKVEVTFPVETIEVADFTIYPDPDIGSVSGQT